MMVYIGYKTDTYKYLHITLLTFDFLGLEEMKLRRTELQAEIESQEEEKNHLQREIEKLSYKLTRLNDSLTKKIAVRNDYDRTIADTETAYIKVCLLFLIF